MATCRFFLNGDQLRGFSGSSGPFQSATLEPVDGASTTGSAGEEGFSDSSPSAPNWPAERLGVDIVNGASRCPAVPFSWFCGLEKFVLLS